MDVKATATNVINKVYRPSVASAIAPFHTVLSGLKKVAEWHRTSIETNKQQRAKIDQEISSSESEVDRANKLISKLEALLSE